ncbi:MAG TPA: DUF6680 family protein [Puia sp.]|jgi:hypothetical protein
MPPEAILKLSDVLTIIALFVGPIAAVQVQKFIETTRETKTSKLWIFKTLMATRGAILSPNHVEALNRIDLEFTGKKVKYKRVINAWKEYFDVLQERTETQEQAAVWASKRLDMLANLLYEMGCSLGYKFDKVLIKRNVYSPKAHGLLEDENQIIRSGLIDLLTGKTNLPINVEHVEWDEDATQKQSKLQEKQSALWDLMITHYKRENDKHISIEN